MPRGVPRSHAPRGFTKLHIERVMLGRREIEAILERFAHYRCFDFWSLAHSRLSTRSKTWYCFSPVWAAMSRRSWWAFGVVLIVVCVSLIGVILHLLKTDSEVCPRDRLRRLFVWILVL
jgi:hypothetical protein